MRIPSLDGLRAISIIMVVIGHAFKQVGDYIDIANLGVHIFFVISAYLIVGILNKDVENGRFSLSTFYFKRFTRTLPAFYAYILVALCLLYILRLFEFDQFWRAPLFLENYHPRISWNDKQWFVGHTWSLAVEEQFYIFIALVFFALNRKIIDKKNINTIFFSVIILVPIIRCLPFFFRELPVVFSGSMHRSFETVADSLAIGGILVLNRKRILESKLFKFINRNVYLLLIIILLMQFANSKWLLSNLGYLPKVFYNLFGITLRNVFIGLLLISVVAFTNNNNFIKFLNHNWVVNIGIWSYSIYLWQQVWLYSWDFSLWIKLSGIVISSICSYYLLERNVLRLRDNYLMKRNDH